MQYDTGVFQRRRVLSDPGMVEEFLEPVFQVNAVVAFQNPAPQGLAETPGAQEYRILNLFGFRHVEKDGSEHNQAEKYHRNLMRKR